MSQKMLSSQIRVALLTTAGMLREAGLGSILREGRGGVKKTERVYGESGTLRGGRGCGRGGMGRITRDIYKAVAREGRKDAG
jgi:hypothetical protein